MQQWADCGVTRIFKPIAVILGGTKPRIQWWWPCKIVLVVGVKRLVLMEHLRVGSWTAALKWQFLGRWWHIDTGRAEIANRASFALNGTSSGDSSICQDAILGTFLWGFSWQVQLVQDPEVNTLEGLYMAFGLGTLQNPAGRAGKCWRWWEGRLDYLA